MGRKQQTKLRKRAHRIFFMEYGFNGPDMIGVRRAVEERGFLLTSAFLLTEFPFFNRKLKNAVRRADPEAVTLGKPVHFTIKRVW